MHAETGGNLRHVFIWMMSINQKRINETIKLVSLYIDEDGMCSTDKKYFN